MRTTLTLDDDLLAQAQHISGLSERSQLIREALLALIQRESARRLSKQWDAHGTEARVEKLLVLRVNRPEILEEMRKSKASKFLGEILSPTAVIIKSGAESKVLAALAEMGLLSEIET